jgi:hypothetical protein
LNCQSTFNGLQLYMPGDELYPYAKDILLNKTFSTNFCDIKHH